VSEQTTATSGSTQRQRHPVLQVFGIRLEVANPRLAALLTMDARQALTTDVRVLGRVLTADAEKPDDAAETAAPQAEDAPSRARVDEAAAENTQIPKRRDVRTLSSEAAVALGFDVVADGLWRSPRGVSVLVAVVDRPLSFAAATHLVRELEARRAALVAGEVTALVVVDDRGTADVFKVALRQDRLQDSMRTVALEDMLELRRLAEFGVLDHRQALTLLVPMALVDVGEILSIIRTSHVNELPDALA
jgi:hypothetical protein